MSRQYIAVEGNIGAGKSTLARLLGNYYAAPLILEEFADNPFLPLFYKDAERYALPLELSFLADRYKQLTVSLELYSMQHIVVGDYIFPKSSLFAGINLVGAEHDLFQAYFKIMNASIPHPDMLIYLDAPVSVLLSNIKKRGREYEQDIQPSYLEKVGDIYNTCIAQAGIKTIIVDRTAIDFLEHHEYLPALMQFADTCTDNKVYRFNL